MWVGTVSAGVGCSHCQGRNNKVCDLTRTAGLINFDCLIYSSAPRVGLGQSLFRFYSFTSPTSTLYFSIFYFFLVPFLTRFIYFFCFSIPSHTTRIIPLHFQAGCRRRRLNLVLVFYVDLCYMYFLVKDACFFVGIDLVLSCGAIIVSPPRCSC